MMKRAIEPALNEVRMKLLFVMILGLTFTGVASAKKFVVVKGSGGASCPQGSTASTGCENPGPTQNGAICCDDGQKKFLYQDPRLNSAIPTKPRQ